MSNRTVESITVPIEGSDPVSALLQVPTRPSACYVLGHGAAAGMRHPFMAAIADGLLDGGIATLRYQFPYMERGAKRPDTPKVAHAAVRSAVAEAARRVPDLSLFAGGKSFGGRMTSQAQAVSPLPGVRGLVFLGFPLHPAGKPSDERAEHLAEVGIPMLFLQGTRDELADLALVQAVVAKLGPLATLKLYEGADHSFHVPARTGRKDEDIRGEMLDAIVKWMEGIRRAASECAL